MNRPVVVGVDGSAASIAAADYAALLATRRAAPLLLLHGYVHPLGYGAAGVSPYTPALPDPRADAATMLARVAAAVRRAHPYLDVLTDQLAAGGGPALIERSPTAEAVVVGHRGLGGCAELVVGSVGAMVAARASGPVVIVRPIASGRADAPVVVGVDGSAGCVPAIEFAFEEAAQRALPLLAVYVVDERVQPAWMAESILDTGVAPWTVKYPQVDVRRQVRPASDAQQAIVDMSDHASLIVVGSRGRGGFAGLLLGSVSQALVHHARCPIAVVHPRAREAAHGLTEKEVDMKQIYAATDRKVAPVLSRPVRHLMSAPASCVGEGVSLGEALADMVRQRLRHLVVVDGQGICRGVVSDRMIVAAWANSPQSLDRETVGSVLEPGSAIVDEAAPVVSVARLMRSAHVDAVVVAGADLRPIGIVTGSDLIAFLAG
ncbi:universal stress protein [Asanoa sp. NPDC049573]|uniref:universal stress protein n=1 Tax=Asanoa sp. NPDC049573 TaxID=3155396 RepID=UPI00341BAB23